MNIPRSAIAQMERIESANERYNEWFDQAVSIVGAAVERGGDVADAINDAYLAADDYEVVPDDGDLRDVVVEAVRRYDSQRMAA